jgi:bifunctional DNA-binding transcriptional regulator/antitoxin component of YhaV-PrlF toxin-antitoxin module
MGIVLCCSVKIFTSVASLAKKEINLYIQFKFHNMETSTLTSKGQILIPKKYFKKFGFKAKQKVAFIEQDGNLIIKPFDKDYFRQFAGILSGEGDVLKELMEEKKREREL